MRAVDHINQAAGSLRGHKLRTALTLLGIVIGVAAVVTMVSIGLGARSQIEGEIGKLGTNLLMVLPDARNTDGLNSGVGGQHTLTEADATALRAEVLGVRYAVPTVTGQARLVFGNRNWRTRIVGTRPNYVPARDWAVHAGRNFTEAEILNRSKVALVGETIVARLSPYEAPLGKIIRVESVPFRIVGVLAPKGHSAVGRDQDDILVVPLSTAKSRLIGGYQQVNRAAVEYILLKADLDASLESVRARTADILRHRHRIGPGRADDFIIHDPTAALAAQREASGTLTILLACIAAVSLVVGGISIMNILLVSVAERTREIGVRIAVGARQGDILAQFLAEAVGVAVLGGLVGAGIGVAAAKIVEASTGWAVEIDGLVLAGALLFSAFIGVCSGLYPAYQASRLDPVEALRHD